MVEFKLKGLELSTESCSLSLIQHLSAYVFDFIFSTDPQLCLPVKSTVIWEIKILQHHQVSSFRFYSRSSIVNVWLLEVVLCHLDFAVNHYELETRNVATGYVVLD